MKAYDNHSRYSVLMSVYKREQPEYLRAAIDSMLGQTLQPYEMVLVCDGPLTDELEHVIADYKQKVNVVRLSQNCGLGTALSYGLQYCRSEWIARMDSDDIALKNRCALQMAYLQNHREVDVLSGVVAEFEGSWATAETAEKHLVCYKKLPSTHQEIKNYIKYRNPVNHPCVMFRKSKALEAGGYQPCPFFEDYDLWIRIYRNHGIFANLTETILLMRISDMHRRRGGITYAKAILDFQTKMYRRSMINLPQYICTTALRIMVSLVPNGFRKAIYDASLRKR